MITANPARQMNAPITSNRSGRYPSGTMPQAIEPATKMPLSVARTRPKVSSLWKVATTPYRPSAITQADPDPALVLKRLPAAALRTPEAMTSGAASR